MMVKPVHADPSPAKAAMGSQACSALAFISIFIQIYMFLQQLNHYGNRIKFSLGWFHRCIVLLALCSYLKTKRKIICYHQDRDLCWYIDCKVYIVNWQLHSRVCPLCICPHFLPRRQICLKEGQQAIYVHCGQRWWFMTSVISHLQCSVENLSQGGGAMSQRFHSETPSDGDDHLLHRLFFTF